MPVANPDKDRGSRGRSGRSQRYSRPAPASQPGPYTNAQRRRVERFRTTPSYQHSIRVARQAGPHTTKPGGDDKSAADMRRGQAYVRSLYHGSSVPVAYTPGTTVPPDIAATSAYRAVHTRAQHDQAAKLAPALTVLDQLTRPLHAVAAAQVESVKKLQHDGLGAWLTESNPAARHAAIAGLENKRRDTFSDVLKQAGVHNKVVRGVAGFGLDVALDPTTYITLGGSTGASVAARAAARKATVKAFRSPAAIAAGDAAEAHAITKGASEAEAAKLGQHARRVHAVRQGVKAGKAAAAGRATNTGLDIRFAGHSVPGVTRATAAAKRAPRAVASRIGLDATRVGAAVDRGQRAVRDATRGIVAEVNPAITPVGVDKEAYAAMRRAARTARAGRQRGDVYAALHAQSFVDRVGAADSQRVLYAIEEGTTHQLPKPLRAEAARFTQSMQKMLKAERRAGIKVGDRTKVGDVVNYVKHLRIEDHGRPRPGSVGARRVAPDFAKTRTEGTLREKNTAQPGSYSEDIGQIVAQRSSQSSRSVAAAKLNQAIAKTGRKLQAGGDIRDHLHTDESLYRVDGADLVKVDVSKSAGRQAVENAGRDKFVILNDQAIKRTVGTVGRTAERSTPGVIFDKAQGVWKIGATVVNPGYYVRNYAGEAQNAYLKENPLRLAKNAATAARALKEVRLREEAVRKGEKYVPGKHADLITQAEKVGAVRAGQYAREVGQLISGESKKNAGKLKGAGPLRRAGRVRDNIEDQFRLASFKGGLDRGLSPERAMERAAKTHFDYGDLTPTERTVLRRIAPFWTFSARNVPLQIKTLLTRPGKFAQYQKIREEVAKAFGIDPGYENNLQPVEKRSAPIPIKWKGHDFTISLGPSGLPLTDLNETPVSLNPAKTADEWLNRAASLVTPFVKDPVELWANFSFFFRDQLERDTSPLVPAPSWAQHLPNKVKELTGLVPDYYDKKTGKYGWGWRAKADYIVSQLPGPVAFANRLTKSSNAAGQSTGAQAIQWLGPRIKPIDAQATELNNLYDEQAKILKQQAELRQRNIKVGHVPPEDVKVFLGLRQRARVVNYRIKQLQLQIEGHSPAAAGSPPAPPAKRAPTQAEVDKAIGG